jgi:3-oxoacyl-[acyl-carrier protein] reductase/2-deoxy-D-gluconate 3-dehydrogenase
MATERFGGLDVVVNVAGGFFTYGPVTGVTPEKLDLELSVNFKTAFFTCQAALPALVARGGGAVVSFASIAAVRSQPNLAAYTAAKSAVAGMTRALAREYRDANVRVNAVAPATVRTADNVAQMGERPDPPYVEIDDVVRVVLFLASDAAAGVTGQIVPVTGRAY